MKFKKTVLKLFAIALILAGGFWLFTGLKEKAALTSKTPISRVSYLCKGQKTIEAAYYTGPPAPTPKPGEPPRPTGSVALKLSDGRSLELPQTISASGIRYANQNESIIFWSKGNGAFVLENNRQTFTGCVALSPDPGNLPQAYADGTEGFSVRYPAGYKINTDYRYQELGPGEEIGGVKFTIPQSTATGTNLSGYDTGVSVEEIPNTKDCQATLFVYPGAKTETVTDGGTQYSVATSTGAGAGNFYEEKIWAIPGTNPCVAVRYLIHSTNIYNYPPGAVKEFDRTSLLNQFDEIRRSLILAP